MHRASQRTPPLPGWSMTKTAAAALAGILIADRRLALDSRRPARRMAGPWRRTRADHAGPPAAHDRRARIRRAVQRPAVRRRGHVARHRRRVRLRIAQTTRRHAGNELALLQRHHQRARGRAAPEPGRQGPLGSGPGTGCSTASACTTPSWSRTPIGTPVLSSFMHATAREWAAFGQFLLQDGVWHGERLLPPGWVDYMRTPTPQSESR